MGCSYVHLAGCTGAARHSCCSGPDRPEGCHSPFLRSLFFSDSPWGGARISAREADCRVTAWPYFGNLIFYFIFTLLTIFPVWLATLKPLPSSFFLTFLFAMPNLGRYARSRCDEGPPGEAVSFHRRRAIRPCGHEAWPGGVFRW
ncbi:hypothetical protein CGRA01v4_12755 [Colletotrichum graminicola]|nr:hypothetical protein CGRA01v4_12755 [Colletotrichum graminicola]